MNGSIGETGLEAIAFLLSVGCKTAYKTCLLLESLVKRVIGLPEHGLLQFALDELKALLDNPAQVDDSESDTETSTYLKRDLPKQKRLFE